MAASHHREFEVIEGNVESREEWVSRPDYPQAMSGTSRFQPNKTPSKSGFLCLSREDAEEIESMARDITYTESEANAVRRKIDLRILPIIILSYISNQLDRTNIGNAHTIPEFNKNFGVESNNRWTLCLSIFYVGYCLLEIPANILQRHIGANRFFFISLTIWGLASLSFVYTKGYLALLILRVFLGAGEAGFYAGMIYYLSFWYKRRELAFRISLCLTGTIPGWMGGLLAFGLVRAHNSDLTGWQFLFLIEALPTLIMAFVILLCLPAFPFTASFLTTREKAIAVARLKEHKPKSHGGISGWEGLKLVLFDLGMWMFIVLYCSCEFTTNVCVATVSYFLPTIIKGFGFDPIKTQGLSAGPYVLAWITVCGQAWHSDKTKDRGYHIMASSIVACAGYIVLALQTEKSYRVSYFACYLVVGGAYSLFPLVMSWAANNLAPTPKRGIGTAFIVSVANCISIAAPQVYFDPHDHFSKAHAMAGGFMFLTFSMAFLLRTRFNLLNKHRRVQLAMLTREEKEMGDAVAATHEVPDTDIRFHYMT